ncbi:nicotinamidase/pyrazinamidase [Burkholderiales bacterium]|nr:nicotinamidase/pyrazinamidase [Burkholderiales bacterium]
MDAEVAQIARLVDAFHAAARPVVFTINAYASPAEASVFRHKLPALDSLQWGGPWAELDPRLRPGEGDITLRKTVPSAFWNTGLRSMLRRWRVDSAVVCGFTTSGCVRASAVDALQNNLPVWVVGEACGDRDVEAHRYNLRDLALKTGEVVDTAAVIAALAHTRAKRRKLEKQ